MFPNFERIAGARIFVVEDEPLIIMLLNDMLEELGCVLMDTATTITDAVEKCRDASFDIALLDINLNGILSLPAAEMLHVRKIPYVLSTGYGTTSDIEGFAPRAIIHKPFKLQMLGEAIATACMPVQASDPTRIPTSRLDNPSS